MLTVPMTPRVNFRYVVSPPWAFECAKWTLRAYLKERGRKSWLVVDEEPARAVTERMIERIPDQPGELRSVL